MPNIPAPHQFYLHQANPIPLRWFFYLWRRRDENPQDNLCASHDYLRVIFTRKNHSKKLPGAIFNMAIALYHHGLEGITKFVWSKIECALHNIICLLKCSLPINYCANSSEERFFIDTVFLEQLTQSPTLLACQSCCNGHIAL